MKAYLLAGGTGKRLWPFSEYRCKACVPVGNVPLAVRTAESLRRAGADEIVIAASHQTAGLRRVFLDNPHVQIVDVGTTAGSAETLERAMEAVPPEGDTVVLFGDCLYDAQDLTDFLQSFQKTEKPLAALLSPVQQTNDSADWICAETDAAGQLTGFSGHPETETYQVLEAFAFRGTSLTVCLAAAGVFEGGGIGGMPPKTERHVETALTVWADRFGAIPALTGQKPFLDLDKPWHILEANILTVRAETAALTANELAEGASIDPAAVINGFVRLGKNSRIGRNVTVNGNLIVGDDTVIDNGAVIDGCAMIGSHTEIRNYCYLEGESVVGSRCKILHAAECSGVLFDGVYLYHYMEMDGLFGEDVDIGASCVCGTLRFDNRSSRHDVCGRRETPRNCANATYIGDHTRTGVNCTFYPGVTIGCNCAIGPGVVVTENVPSNQMLLLKQELIAKPWGPEKYGW